MPFGNMHVELLRLNMVSGAVCRALEVVKLATSNTAGPREGLLRISGYMYVGL